MLNFTYANPTRLVFGRGAQTLTGETVRSALGRTGKVLVLYGLGSAKRTGVLDRVEASLEAAGMRVIEMGGVQPNPRMSFVRETTDWIRDQGIKAIVAVGGGSVIDTAKAVAAALEYEGDGWDFFDGRAVPQKALPVFAVLTIPAAGSEQSTRCVITHHGAKIGMGADCLRPKAAVIDPQCFATLPANQISAGVMDMAAHILERYFSSTPATDFVDAQAEAALRTIFKFGPIVHAHPDDYDAWCQIALAGTFAHNGFYGLGRQEDWACHALEHEISGWNDAVVHGEGLAVVVPAWMKFAAKRAPKRLADFAVRVMGVEALESNEETADLGIEALLKWIRSMHLPTTLKELGAQDCPIDSLAHHCCRKGPVGRYVSLNEADAAAILRSAV